MKEIKLGIVLIIALLAVCFFILRILIAFVLGIKTFLKEELLNSTDKQDIYNYAYRHIIDRNEYPEKVKRRMLYKGASLKEAEIIIEHVLNQCKEIEREKKVQKDNERSIQLEKTNQDIELGLFLLIVGVILTPLWIFFWDNILSGIMQIIKGSFNRIRLKLKSQIK